MDEKVVIIRFWAIGETGVAWELGQKSENRPLGFLAVSWNKFNETFYVYFIANSFSFFNLFLKFIFSKYKIN